ncbi:hypothetical protein [Iodobacter ciconiae]|uniref:Uncharacterized protein n=1 Tax=Iodobacter ciconiae TaxID=2496266 RepID=A0A3S8ZRK1_9NEIS|nr:hypothetical protein [Iodobacter ciconiae]AZN36123.1 hypothetical protein EJO50_06300 [Iodobacter ciconiae]
MKSWGVPNSSVKLSNGDTILQYSRTSYDEYHTYHCEKKFIIRKGIIKKFSYSGCGSPKVVLGRPFYPAATPVPGTDDL